MIFRYDMCRRRKGGRCTKGTAGNFANIFFILISEQPVNTEAEEPTNKETKGQ